MRDERCARLFERLVTAAFEGRDEDHVGRNAHHHLGVEVALDADLTRAAVLQLGVDLRVEEVACAGQTGHEVAAVEGDEVGELERSHADHLADGYLDPLVALRRPEVTATRHKGIVVGTLRHLSLFVLLLRVLDINQPHAALRSQAETLGIARLESFGTFRIGRVRLARSVLFLLSAATCHHQ